MHHITMASSSRPGPFEQYKRGVKNKTISHQSSFNIRSSRNPTPARKFKILGNEKYNQLHPLNIGSTRNPTKSKCGKK
jgi:hypothetical protein